MDRKKKLKITAAVAAIMNFEAENEAAVALPAAATTVAPQTFLPLWALAGRQDSMMTRTLWQRRIGRG